MAKSLSSKFSSKTVSLNDEDLETLNEQLKALREKVAAGHYIIAAKAETTQGEGHNTSDSLMTVVIKPADGKAEASIKSMTFRFDYKGRPNGIDSNQIDFNIKTADGKIFTYRASRSHGNDFLGDVYDLGVEKITSDYRNNQLAASEAKRTTIKNSIKL